MDVLVTETAASQYGHRLDGVTLVRMQDDGSLERDGVPVEWDDARPDVAWASADLFEDGAPLRPFFGLLVKNAGAIRWLQSSAAGVDAPVFADLVRAGTRLTTSHVTDIPIAEFVLRAVLEHFQRGEDWRANEAERGWRRHDFREVAGTTWLVVGLGAIGSAIATRAKAFGATVVGVRRTPTDDTITPDRLLDAVPDADVVVLAAPATNETTHLVDEGFLRRMKSGSLLVNIARGALVDETALLAALDRGTPEHAILDVTSTEPLPPDDPLWAHPRTTITPHNAAGGIGRLDRAADLFADNLRRYLAGEPLRHEVDPSDLGT